MTTAAADLATRNVLGNATYPVRAGEYFTLVWDVTPVLRGGPAAVVKAPEVYAALDDESRGVIPLPPLVVRPVPGKPYDRASLRVKVRNKTGVTNVGALEPQWTFRGVDAKGRPVGAQLTLTHVVPSSAAPPVTDVSNPVTASAGAVNQRRPTVAEGFTTVVAALLKPVGTATTVLLVLGGLWLALPVLRRA